MSGASGSSERANGRASGPVLLSEFLVDLVHSVMVFYGGFFNGLEIKKYQLKWRPSFPGPWSNWTKHLPMKNDSSLNLTYWVVHPVDGENDDAKLTKAVEISGNFFLGNFTFVILTDFEDEEVHYGRK